MFGLLSCCSACSTVHVLGCLDISRHGFNLEHGLKPAFANSSFYLSFLLLRLLRVPTLYRTGQLCTRVGGMSMNRFGSALRAARHRCSAKRSRTDRPSFVLRREANPPSVKASSFRSSSEMLEGVFSYLEARIPGGDKQVTVILIRGIHICAHEALSRPWAGTLLQLS